MKKYWIKLESIQAKIWKIRERLIIHHDNQQKNDKNYAYIGDLTKIDKDLQEIINFLSTKGE